MAYPFAQAPTVTEFVDRLRAHGCEHRGLPPGIHGPHGPIEITYLLRKVGDKELLSEPLPTDHNERLSPDTVRRLLVQLELPATLWPWAGDPYTLTDDDRPSAGATQQS